MEETPESPQDPEPQDPEPSEPGEESAEGTEEGAEGEPPAPKGGHKRQGGYQRRIERLQRQNQMLLDQLQRGTSTPTGAPKEKTAEEKAAEQFQQLVDRRIAERDAERQAKSQIESFANRAVEVRAKHEDWDDVISGIDIPSNSPLGQAILSSDHGPELMYQLGSDPAELARLSSLSPFAAARELGKMEAKIAATTATTKTVTKRPPVPPSSTKGAPSAATRDISTLPLAEYKAAQRKRLKGS